MAPGAGVTVEAFLDDPDIRDRVQLVAGETSVARMIGHPRIQKSGLALVGHHHGLVSTRIQVLGGTEITFLETLSESMREERCAALFALELSLVLVTRGARPGPILLGAARGAGTPLALTPLRSSQAIRVVHDVLDRMLAPTETLHGVLVEVHGIGILITGASGIGKSECALSLLDRGHRLVADDRVVVTRSPAGAIVVGRPPALLRHHLEVRGIGILNARDLYGATAVRDAKRVDLVVELCRPGEGDDAIERLGLDDLEREIVGVSLPMLRIPVQPGRNMAVILEVAARNQLIKRSGRHPAREFIESLKR